jgi:hypothetical protein
MWLAGTNVYRHSFASEAWYLLRTSFYSEKHKLWLHFLCSYHVLCSLFVSRAVLSVLPARITCCAPCSYHVLCSLCSLFVSRAVLSVLPVRITCCAPCAPCSYHVLCSLCSLFVSRAVLSVLPVRIMCCAPCAPCSYHVLCSLFVSRAVLLKIHA